MAIDFEAAARQFGTPLYVYDLDAIEARIRELRGILPAQVKLLYAVKANPNLRLLEALRGKVDGLDISSGGELDLALRAGYPASTLSFSGPGKSLEELQRALRAGCLLSAESVREIRALADLARETGARARITVRINPTFASPKFSLKMGGRPSAFGVDEERLEELVPYLQSPELEVLGFHVYAGTQCLDAESLCEHFEKEFETFARASRVTGIRPRVLNLGGGFGIPLFEDSAPLETQKVAACLGRLVQERGPELGCEVFYLELGRYLVGEAGYYLTRVLTVKESRGKPFAVLDGGMHHHLAASGNLGQVIRKNYRLHALSQGPEAEYTLAGCLCTPIDVLGQQVHLPSLREGDLVVIENSGAYGLTASPLLFLGHPTPAEVLHTNGSFLLARRRVEAHLLGLE